MQNGVVFQLNEERRSGVAPGRSRFLGCGLTEIVHPDDARVVDSSTARIATSSAVRLRMLDLGDDGSAAAGRFAAGRAALPCGRRARPSLDDPTCLMTGRRILPRAPLE